MTSYESEDVTRRQRVNPRLRAADWGVVRFAAGDPLTLYRTKAVEEFPTAAGPVDYALCDGGRALGVVEAKKVTRGPEGVLTRPNAIPAVSLRARRRTGMDSVFRSSIPRTGRSSGSTMCGTR
jgi:hypothetical protein